MASTVECVTIACVDPRRVSDFWAAALGYERTKDQGDWIELEDPKHDGPMLGFQRVPEPKTVKDRIHLDLKPSDGIEAEVRRLEGLGAKRVQFVNEDPSSVHMVMADPEGNEFCVV